MKKYVFYEKLEQLFPVETALSGDKFGVLIDVPKDEINKILIALDINPAIVDEAFQEGCDLILTHHPLFFRSVERIDLDSTGNIIRALIKKDIGLYSVHTNFDARSKLWLDLLKLTNIKFIEPTSADTGIGYIGELPESLSFADFVDKIKNITGSKNLRYVGKDKSFMVKKIALCPGSGMSLIKKVIPEKVDIYLTGDVKYHDALYAYLNGLRVLDIGHYDSEVLLKNEMASILKEYVDVVISQKDINPFEVV